MEVRSLFHLLNRSQSLAQLLTYLKVAESVLDIYRAACQLPAMRLVAYPDLFIAEDEICQVSQALPAIVYSEH